MNKLRAGVDLAQFVTSLALNTGLSEPFATAPSICSTRHLFALNNKSYFIKNLSLSFEALD